MAPYTRFKRGLKRRMQEFCAWRGEIKTNLSNGLEVGFHFLNRKYDAPCHLLGLPVELLFQIMKILQEATAISSDEDECQYPLLSLRL
jgi:hypothetical protein